MAYDIPPPLQHKEKIIFGLTFSQLAYAFPAVLVMFFVVFKTPLSLEISGTISVLIGCLASFFMFFDGAARIRSWYSYLRNPKVKVLDKLLRQIVDIRKIEEDVIHQSKARLAVLEVIPMNFMLKTEEEKESIILGFQKFLNSLDFPIQIHISSHHIKLNKHFEHVDEQVKAKIENIEETKPRSEKEAEAQKKEIEYLNNLTDSYCGFVRKAITDNKVLNRKFHIIIKEKDLLETQVKVCSERLTSIGLKVKRLEDKDLSPMIKSYIAGKTDKDFDDEVTDVGHFMYAPKEISFQPDHFIADDRYCKVISVTGYPHSVELGFLDNLISSGEKYDISIHIEPFPIDTTMIHLNRDLQKQQSDLYTDSKKGILNPSLEIKYNSTRKVLEDLQKGKQKLFNVSLYMMCTCSRTEQEEEVKKQLKRKIEKRICQKLRNKIAKKIIENLKGKNPEEIKKQIDETTEKAISNQKKQIQEKTLQKYQQIIEERPGEISKQSAKKSKEEIDLLARKIKANLDGIMIQSSTPAFRMIEGYASMLPLASDRLKIKRNIHTEGLAAFFPFSSPFLDIENDGILLGLNKNKIPYIKDIFRLANANGIVLATSGSGKSYFTKLLLSRQYMNSCDIMIIDPQGEYLALTNHYRGECITISKNSKTIINPLDLMGHEYLEKRLSLMDLFYIMFGGDLNELQKSILDKAIDLTYENCGITRDDHENHEPPTMSDLFETLLKLEKGAVHQEKVTYRALLNRIRMYTQQGVFGFMDRQTQINFDSRFVCFNIGHMPKQVKAVVMYLLLDFVFMRMRGSKRRKLLVIDEAWSMLQTAEESSYVFEIVKTCRKWNLGLLMITQDVADLVMSKAGHAVLANTSYTFLLRQKPAVIGNVAKTFNLSQPEKDFLVTAQLGNGILILENEHQEIEVISSPEEHKLITTNPDEMAKMSEEKKPKPAGKKKEKERANIDFKRLVYPAKGLTILQQNTLNNHGYVLKKGHGLNSGPCQYYIKRRHPESLEHTLLVGLIIDEIKKYTDKVWTYQTKQADIIFKNAAGQKIALEIETGKELQKHKNRTDEKFKEAKKKHGGRVYIVLNRVEYVDSYAKYGIRILARKDIKKFTALQFSGQKNINIGEHLKAVNKKISRLEALKRKNQRR